MKPMIAINSCQMQDLETGGVFEYENKLYQKCTKAENRFGPFNCILIKTGELAFCHPKNIVFPKKIKIIIY